MAKKNDAKDEIQEAPVNPVEGIKLKVNEAVRAKIEAVIKEFQVQQDQGFEELEKLQSQLEGLEAKKGALCAERKSLTSGVFGVGVKGAFDLDLKLRGLEKEIKSFEAQKGKLFSRLTEIPKFDFQTLNFLTNLTRKG